MGSKFKEQRFGILKNIVLYIMCLPSLKIQSRKNFKCCPKIFRIGSIFTSSGKGNELLDKLQFKIKNFLKRFYCFFSVIESVSIRFLLLGRMNKIL
ncbi:hypothetical protein LEP1GSC062_1716 [Leptospira alexanderi serovar Manhao 3 str. L 60]|uniref:Uncharacterized protein n=1 Tax=Leptospira alexanderi serovar Manhao 3 str. L 60 TaxID=1049759 RepID=V6HUB0_9LEPT|nr:hypothetical protein LEP1GSC062_1716 [Leptospira alexanderi serovar Manhao 3 str. L 60]